MDRRLSETLGFLGELAAGKLFPELTLTVGRQSNKRGIMDGTLSRYPGRSVQIVCPKPGNPNLYLRHYTVKTTEDPGSVHLGLIRAVSPDREDPWAVTREGSLLEGMISSITMKWAVELAGNPWNAARFPKKKGEPWREFDRIIPWEELIKFPLLL